MSGLVTELLLMLLLLLLLPLPALLLVLLLMLLLLLDDPVMPALKETAAAAYCKRSIVWEPFATHRWLVEL